MKTFTNLLKYNFENDSTSVDLGEWSAFYKKFYIVVTCEIIDNAYRWRMNVYDSISFNRLFVAYVKTYKELYDKIKDYEY